MENETKEDLTKKDFLIASGMGLVSLAVYFFTLSPTVTGEDSGELITAAYAFGVAHPPGYPLWCLLGKLFSFLPFGKIAFRINFMSAFFGSFSVALLYLIARNFHAGTLPSGSASLALAFSKRFWSQSVISEVYTLNIFFLLLCILLLQTWEKDRKTSRLYLTALAFGFGLANHYMLLLLTAPALLGYVLITEPRINLKGRLLLICLACILPGLLVYAYLPLAASANPPLNWGDPSTLKSFLTHIGRFQYRSLELAEKTPLSTKLLFIGHFLIELWKQFSPYVLLFGLWGAAIAFKNKKLAILTYGIFFFNSMVLIFILHFSFEGDNLERVQEYYLPAYAMVAIWISLALEKVFEKTRSEKLWKIPGYLVLLAVAFLPLLSNFEENDRSDDYFACDYNNGILEGLEKDAIYIPGGDYSSFPAIYLQAVEGIRKDVILGNITGYLSPDYMKYASSLPGYDRRLSGKDLEAFVIRNSNRPVYYNQKSDIPGRGKLVVVPQGLVFRVLPETPSPEAAPRWNCDNALRTASRFKASNEVVVSILTDFHVKKGEYYFSIGDEAKGAEEWEKASEISRHTKEILNNVGCGYAEHGLYEQAEEKFKESIRIYPGYRLGFKNLAKLFEDTGRLKEAVSVYETLIELEPEAEEYSAKLKQLASGLQTERIAEQLELISRNPDEPSAWNNLGNIYAEEHNYDKAIAAYEKALELNPDYALPHLNLSRVYENLEEAEKASYHRQRYEMLK